MNARARSIERKATGVSILVALQALACAFFLADLVGDVVADGITVNAVNPGLIASARAMAVLGDEGLATYGATVPVGRAGTPEDVAHACLFLASAHSSYITGTSIKMDGGSSVAVASGRNDLLQNKLKQQREIQI